MVASGVPGDPDDPENVVLRMAVDVTEPGQVDDFARLVVQRFGRIDLWVNNAGVLAPIGPLAEADAAEVAANVAVNILGVAHGSQAMARHVRTRVGGGVLVNVSSGAARRPYAGWAPYCASKAAVDMLTGVVALEERHAGLRAYAVAPGVVDTDMQAAIRATDEHRFPEVERFRQLRADHAFSSPGWVADRLLDLAFGPGDPGGLLLRVPTEPGPRPDR
jgi:NAD(P)-dependent dehydrogenase (short-subunit alcohol dehydrogenase family)